MPRGSSSELEANMEAFQEQLPKLLLTDEGRYAVGRVGDDFSCWDTYGDALQAGYDKYSPKSFVVCQVIRVVEPLIFTRDSK